MTKGAAESTQEAASLILVAREAIERIIKYYPTYASKSTPDFRDDASIEFTVRAMQGLVTTEPFSYLRNLLKTLSYDIANNTVDIEYILGQVDSGMSVPDAMEIEEKLKETLLPLPVHLRMATLYSLKSSDKYDVPEFLTDIEKLLVLEAKSNIMSETGSYEGETTLLPETMTGKILLLSMLKRYNEETLALMSLFRDPVKLFQLAAVYGGKSFRVPTYEELLETFGSAKEAVIGLETNRRDLTLRDHQVLSKIAVSVNEEGDYTVEHDLMNFLNKSMNIAVTEYKRLLENTVDKLQTSDIDKIEALMNLFDKEIRSQVGLIADIRSSITDPAKLSEMALKQSKLLNDVDKS